MIHLILSLFLFFFVQTDPYIVECLDEERFIAWTWSRGGEISADAEIYPDIAIDNITGTPTVWTTEALDGYRFLAERAIFAEDGDVHYLYFLTNDVDVAVLTMVDFENDAPDYKNPHGCGAYIVNKDDVAWLTDSIWKRGL